MRVRWRKHRILALDIRKRCVTNTTKGKVFDMLSRIMGWVGIICANILFLLALFSVVMFDMHWTVLIFGGALVAILTVMFVWFDE